MKLEALKRPQTSAKAVDCTVVTRLALNRVHNSAKAQQLLFNYCSTNAAYNLPCVHVLLDMTRPSPNRNTVLHDTMWNVQWSNSGGTRGNDVPLLFSAGERRSPSLHDRCGWTRKTAFCRSMTATYNTSNRKSVHD